MALGLRPLGDRVVIHARKVEGKLQAHTVKFGAAKAESGAHTHRSDSH